MKDTVKVAIEQLLCYGLKKGLIDEIDKIYSRNLLIDLLNIDEPAANFDADSYTAPDAPHEILKVMCDYAVSEDIIEDTITYRDLFDTRIMDTITPLPSTVVNKYNFLKENKSIRAATDYFYGFSKSTNYIRTERIAKNIIWNYTTKEYGDLVITINLSKPEKDPKEIAKLKFMPKSGYPSCLLCKENMGYAGRLNHPARQTHRLIPVTMNNENWFFQYSPYIYYNEHIIALKGEHSPMFITKDTIVRLLDFVDAIPHYFLGSNAGLPIVGGSILNHDHYQGGGEIMPMAKAAIYKELKADGYSDVDAGFVKWPMTCIRLSSKNKAQLADAAYHVISSWEAYSDEARGIYANTDGEDHNAVTPITRNVNGTFQVDLVLRNNLTSDELPMGIFHPHPHLHHIKKENIGLIEVMGTFILPGRLKVELSKAEDILTGKLDIKDIDESMEKHLPWINTMMSNSNTPMSDVAAHELVQSEIGRICLEVIECAGVFKDTEDGRAGLAQFAASCGIK